MDYAAIYIGTLRRRLKRLLPSRWLAPLPPTPPGLRASQISRAGMELEAEAPASSWVAWEVSGRRTRMSPRERGRRA
jgi:hypothetical protein